MSHVFSNFQCAQATKEEKAAKLDKRLTEDTEQQIHVCVFRVNDISHPQKKYKVLKEFHYKWSI
jgi:hypothetical protein